MSSDAISIATHSAMDMTAPQATTGWPSVWLEVALLLSELQSGELA